MFDVKKLDPVNAAVIALAVVGLITLVAAPVTLLITSDVQVARIRAWVPTASFLITVAGVLLAAWTYNRGMIERRRERTMEAWEAYTHATGPLIRRELTTDDGKKMAVEETEVRDLLLVRRRTEASAANDPDTLKKIKRVHALFEILNRIERLAAGCDTRVYDRRLLAELARKRLLTTIERLDPLITAARAEQASAFDALNELRDSLNSK